MNGTSSRRGALPVEDRAFMRSRERVSDLDSVGLDKSLYT